MKLVASRDLPRHLIEMAYLPGGDLIILSDDAEASFLEAYSAQLVPNWTTRLEHRALALVVSADGTPWVLDSTGVTAIGDRGVRVVRLDVPTGQRMELSAFAQVENGFVLAAQHVAGSPLRAPNLQRIAHDGTVCWSTTLPVETVAFKGVVEVRADRGWRPSAKKPWTPETWFSTPGALSVSGDCVLACFREMPRTGIGFGYVVSVSDGSLLFTTRKGPIGQVAAFGGGAFLIGYQGYGTFETLLYERDGRVRRRWASHGHYVVSGPDIRVIELENVLPSRMRLVRLRPRGSIAKGALLDGYATSRPFLGADGTLFFFRNGALQAARDLRIHAQLVLCSTDVHVRSRGVVGDDRTVYLALSQYAKNGDRRLVRVEY